LLFHACFISRDTRVRRHAVLSPTSFLHEAITFSDLPRAGVSLITPQRDFRYEHAAYARRALMVCHHTFVDMSMPLMQFRLFFR